MTRFFKKFYVFAIFLVGIFFWALIKNIGLPEGYRGETVDGSIASYTQTQKELIDKHLNILDGEIAAQKIYSRVLLQKIKTKYSENSKAKENSNSNKDDVFVISNEETKQKAEKEKLLALQKLLQLEAHAGEVRSDIVNNNNAIDKDNDRGEQDNHPGGGDELGNGEVIDHIPPNKIIKSKSSYTNSDDETVIAVLVFVCDRPTIKRSLDLLVKYRSSEKKFPIVVSQDCGSHPATTNVIDSYGDQLTHIMQPDLTDIIVPPKEKKMKGYYKIARHYGWALNHTFNSLGFNNVIIVEDDLDIAPDFFEYFSATLPIMRKDPSIWCVSAWNDNGKPKRINETAYSLLHRTDFFPGLGWMMTKDLWTELMVKWPKGYWDDWMREPDQRKDRVCIRPEISRTKTFGKEGVSHGTYYMNHLRFIKLNDHLVPFTSLDLTYLLKDNYDVEFVRRVYSSHLINSVTELTAVTAESPSSPPIEYRLVYKTKTDFRNYAKKLELMEDFKAGVPRTAYRGVVPFVLNGHKCYLAPDANWESYQAF